MTPGRRRSVRSTTLRAVALAAAMAAMRMALILLDQARAHLPAAHLQQAIEALEDDLSQ